MNNYIITSDSTTDLPYDFAKKNGIHTIPLTFNIDGSEYDNTLDGSSLAFKEFYRLLRSGKTSSTSQINRHTFITEFTSFLEQGLDILCLSFSSGLSGTYGQAMLAADDLREKYPERTILVVDTLCASLGEGLLVYMATQQKAAGKSIFEVKDFVENTKMNIGQFFTVDDLNHLRRGGRLSAATAFMGTLLNVKPILHVNNEGKLIPLSKVRGRKKSLDTLYEIIAEKSSDIKNTAVFISHGDCLEDAEYLAGLINDNLHPKEIVINYVGPVIGSHSGPGTIAMFFVGDRN